MEFEDETISRVAQGIFGMLGRMQELELSADERIREWKSNIANLENMISSSKNAADIARWEAYIQVMERQITISKWVATQQEIESARQVEAQRSLRRKQPANVWTAAIKGSTRSFGTTEHVNVNHTFQRADAVAETMQIGPVRLKIASEDRGYGKMQILQRNKGMS